MDDVEHEFNEFFGKSSRKELVEIATEHIISKYSFITLEENDEIYYYNEGVYVTGGEILIGKELEKAFSYQIDTSKLAQVIGHVKRRTYHKGMELDSDIDIINLKNGLYNIERDELYPHTPKYLSINQSNIFYDKKAKPKRFGSFLEEVFYARDIRTAVEAMAYTFHRDYTIEVIFMLHGLGLNGKSVYTSVTTALHGADNVSNVPLSEMLLDKFALSDLEKKALNIDNELSRQTIRESAALKRLTGGSRQKIRIQRKNQRAYDTYLYAKLFFNANKVPESQDDSDAFNRRIMIISFPNRFEHGIEDKRLTAKLTSREELAGIFNCLMIALRRIRSTQNIFVNEKTIEERRAKYQRANKPINAFIEDSIDEESTENCYLSKADLYTVYLIYCGKYSLPPEKYDSFCKLVKKTERETEMGIQIGETRKDLGQKNLQGKPKLIHCWTGIKLTAEFAELLSMAKGGVESQRTLDDKPQI